MASSKSFCLDGLKLAFRGSKVILETKRSFQRPIYINSNDKGDLNPVPLSLSLTLNNFLLFQCIHINFL